MARGKNKAIAERRREALEELGSLERLQRRNLELEKENQTLKDQLDSAIDTHVVQISSLHEQLEKNTSPKVKELEYIIEKLNQKQLELEESTKKIKDLWTDGFYSLVEYFMKTDSIKYAEAIEKAMEVIRAKTILYDEESIGEFLKKHSKDISEEEMNRRLKTLQKIRGLR